MTTNQTTAPGKRTLIKCYHLDHVIFFTDDMFTLVDSSMGVDELRKRCEYMFVNTATSVVLENKAITLDGMFIDLMNSEVIQKDIPKKEDYTKVFEYVTKVVSMMMESKGTYMFGMEHKNRVIIDGRTINLVLPRGTGKSPFANHIGAKYDGKSVLITTETLGNYPKGFFRDSKKELFVLDDAYGADLDKLKVPTNAVVLNIFTPR